jgi:hypothetical protein
MTTVRSKLAGAFDLMFLFSRGLDRFSGTKQEALRSIGFMALMFAGIQATNYFYHPKGLEEIDAATLALFTAAHYLLAVILSLALIAAVAQALKAPERFWLYLSASNWTGFLISLAVLPLVVLAAKGMLVRDGIRLIKLFITIGPEMQMVRLHDRWHDPLKRWKLSPIDLAARERYADYGLARDRMFKATHTAHAPWRLVNFNDQRRGRIELLNDLLGRLPVPETAPETFDFPPLRSKPLPDRTTPLP